MKQREQLRDLLDIAFRVRPGEGALERGGFAHRVAAAHARRERRHGDTRRGRRRQFETLEVRRRIVAPEESQVQRPEVEPDVLVAGRELARPHEVGHGEGPASRTDQRLRGVVAGIETGRRARRRRFECARRFAVPPAREEHVSAGEPRLRPLGAPLRGGGERPQRLAVAMLGGKHDAEIVMELRALRRDLDGLPVRDDRAVSIARGDAIVGFAQEHLELAVRGHFAQRPATLTATPACWRQPHANQANDTA